MSDRAELFHAAVPDDWAARSTTHYVPAGYADEGFIHCSSASQLIGTLEKHYPGRSDLILLRIDPALVTAQVVLEDLYGSGVEFPHIYGELNLSAIVQTHENCGLAEVAQLLEASP